MIKLVGVLCLLTAFVLLAFSGLMFALETPLPVCLGIGMGSLFPLALAVACFLPRYRNLAIRFVGGIICVAGLGSIIASFADNDFRATFKQRAVMLTIAVAGAVMAARGKWPGESSQTKGATTDVSATGAHDAGETRLGAGSPSVLQRQ